MAFVLAFKIFFGLLQFFVSPWHLKSPWVCKNHISEHPFIALINQLRNLILDQCEMGVWFLKFLWRIWYSIFFWQKNHYSTSHVFLHVISYHKYVFKKSYGRRKRVRKIRNGAYTFSKMSIRQALNRKKNFEHMSILWPSYSRVRGKNWIAYSFLPIKRVCLLSE